MKVKYFLTIFVFATLLFGCKTNIPTEFDEGAKNESFLNKNGDLITLEEILSKHRGKRIVIAVWASWCKDCIKGIPDLKQLQDDHANIKFVFLSLDRSIENWKYAIEKYQLTGDQFYMISGWDGNFSKFLNLDWIPRYLVIDENGKIIIYKSIRAKDIQLKKTLQ